MNDDIKGDDSSGNGISNRSRRRPSKICLVLTIATITLVVTLPFVYSQLNPHQGLVQTMVFVLESPNSSWCIGEGRIWFEDDSFELLSPWPAAFKESTVYTSNVWQALMPVDRRFSESIICNLEYTCTELNITIGPISFNSDQFHILYQDISGNMIYVCGGYVNPE